MNYDWENDHTFVKASGAQTGVAFTLVEDNLKAAIAIGLHRPDHDIKTFYVLEGTVEFSVDDHWIKAVTGTTRCVLPGVLHACKVTDGPSAGMNKRWLH